MCDDVVDSERLGRREKLYKCGVEGGEVVVDLRTTSIMRDDSLVRWLIGYDGVAYRDGRGSWRHLHVILGLRLIKSVFRFVLPQGSFVARRYRV